MQLSCLLKLSKELRLLLLHVGHLRLEGIDAASQCCVLHEELLPLAIVFLGDRLELARELLSHVYDRYQGLGVLLA